MQANKPYISTGLRHIFAIISSQIAIIMEPFNAILKHKKWQQFNWKLFNLIATS